MPPPRQPPLFKKTWRLKSALLCFVAAAAALFALQILKETISPSGPTESVSAHPAMHKSKAFPELVEFLSRFDFVVQLWASFWGGIAYIEDSWTESYYNFRNKGTIQPSNFKIPKVVHQTWKTKSLSSETLSIMAENKRLNPDLEFKLWDDAEVEQFLRDGNSFSPPRTCASIFFLTFHARIPGRSVQCIQVHQSFSWACTRGFISVLPDI